MSRAGKPTYECKNCGCMRYTPCGCMKSKKVAQKLAEDAAHAKGWGE
jgi:hypothetical protein